MPAPQPTSISVFPKPGTVLANVIGDPAYRETFHQRLQSSNRFVVLLYRIGILPLLGAGKTMMLLTTRGRKTNHLRRFPVGYFRIGGDVHLLSGWGRESNWYKNLCANPDMVSLQIGFRTFPVRAEVVEDPAEMKRTLECLILESPESAQRLFGWDSASDRLDQADFAPMLEKVLMVKFVNR
jgi:deazaflavin-dependent oxidoreductase (nitroreductase family)